MNWWGKIIGGTVGFMIGGPLGGLLGVALGHQADKGSLRSEGSPSGDPERVQTAFFTATFSVMGHIAKADGRVSEDEIVLARHVMQSMALTPLMETMAKRLFSVGKQADFPLDDVLDQLRKECHRRRTLLQMFVEIQFAAAYADGVLHREERRILLYICEQLGFSRQDFERLEGMVRAEQRFGRSRRRSTSTTTFTLEDSYAILNISPDVSDSEVKKAYRRLMNQHHPDKLVAKGLPEEMMKLAAQKTHEIRTAYERIREARGF